MQDSFQKKALLEIEKISRILSSEGFSVTKADKKLYNYGRVVNRKPGHVFVSV